MRPRAVTAMTRLEGGMRVSKGSGSDAPSHLDVDFVHIAFSMEMENLLLRSAVATKASAGIQRSWHGDSREDGEQIGEG